MTLKTTPDQRRKWYEKHQDGEGYQEIADLYGLSQWCVRYWCRRQRDGGSSETVYHRHQAQGSQQRIEPRVRYVILRLRLEHPRWGPNRILAGLKKRPFLRELRLPSEATIGRYLHQWPRFCRGGSVEPTGHPKPDQPTQVHQRWQVDFKLGIPLQDGTQVNLHTVRDPVGEAVIAERVTPAGLVGEKPCRVTLSELQETLRRAFCTWHTLPDQLQTDNEGVFVGKSDDSFPAALTLWLVGFDIRHIPIRPGKPTDNAEVERCHRTVYDYAIAGKPARDIQTLQTRLDIAVHELNEELSLRAEGCAGQPPVKAHPELLIPRRSFRAEHELALFDLQRVDTYLATFIWKRKVGINGQVSLGGQHNYYTVDRTLAGQNVSVCFDSSDRHFVFYDTESTDHEMARRPARHLDLSDLTGSIPFEIQQLALSPAFFQRVSC